MKMKIKVHFIVEVNGQMYVANGSITYYHITNSTNKNTNSAHVGLAILAGST